MFTQFGNLLHALPARARGMLRPLRTFGTINGSDVDTALRSRFARLPPDLQKATVRLGCLQLLLRNVRSGTILSCLLVLVVYFSMRDIDPYRITLWCAAAAGYKLVCYVRASYLLRRGLNVTQLGYLVRWQVLINVVDGTLWGSLMDVAFEHAGPDARLFIMAVLTGVAAGGASSLAPVLPVFIAYVLPGTAMAMGSLLSIPGETFSIPLVLACSLYILALLAHAANVSRVVRSSIELRYENVELIQRLRNETERLLIARLKAENATRTKTRFLAAASHDLRQPIHAFGLFLGVLARTHLSPVQATIHANAFAAYKASSSMLNTLLDFSRIEAGVVRAEIRPCALDLVLEKIENDLAPTAESKGLSLRFRHRGRVVETDPHLLELILRNLVSNAVRYTDTGGVFVGSRLRRDGYVSIEVWDTGIGIPRGKWDEIFQEFHQLGPRSRDRQRGLGLGLAIVKGLATVLRHELRMNSVVGRGSVFRLVVPLSFRAEAPRPVVRGLDGLVEQVPRGLRVLVVDDDVSVRDAMLELLSGWGCVATAVGDLASAQAVFNSGRFQLVVSDLRLDEASSVQDVLSFLQEAVARGAPAILVTADTAPGWLREAAASGIPLLHKPTTPEQLALAIVEAIHKQAHARSERRENEASGAAG